MRNEQCAGAIQIGHPKFKLYHAWSARSDACQMDRSFISTPGNQELSFIAFPTENSNVQNYFFARTSAA